MVFESFLPSDQLKNLVKEFWIVENEDPAPYRQKIIPDGYSEIIIHYGDPYKINLNGNWESQSNILFSNQISKYFFLENTGTSGMIGIKLHPLAFFELFGQNMDSLTDVIVPLDSLIPEHHKSLMEIAKKGLGMNERVHLAESWLISITPKSESKVRLAIDRILEQKGITDIEALASEIDLSARQLERQFKKMIGLTPKFYSRIIRFSNIFQVMDSEDTSWVKIALQSGYFDQSHFIRNFKEFTGEEPSAYGFNEKNMANFFLKK